MIECSVIIPSYQSAGTLAACLFALRAQRGAPPYEIIVVDSSPHDAAVDICAQFPGVQLVRLPRQTDPGQARNLGARQARGNVLAFIDADCLAAPDWLQRLQVGLAQGFDGVGGAIGNANAPDDLVAWAGYVCEFREFLPLGPARAADNLTLGNAAYWREAFWSVGGFPVDCFPQEDQVFHQALGAQGSRLYFDPGLVVWHRHRSDQAEFLSHQRRIGSSNARVARRLDLPAAILARRRWLAVLAVPLLVPYRWARTLAAGWPVLSARLVRQPALAGLCLLGMVGWGWGFVEGALSHPDSEEIGVWPRTLPT